jgi:drug/metabolite transporter (DMT)-like permease
MRTAGFCDITRGMAQPQSPFDESDEPLSPPQAESQLPPRKWSFVVLGVVLFVLVWVREFTQMPPSLTISLAVLVLILWAILHIFLYTTWPQQLVEQNRAAGRSGAELLESSRPRSRGGAVQAAALAGILGGIWLQGTMPVSPVGMSIIVLVVAAFVYGSGFLASRL